MAYTVRRRRGDKTYLYSVTSYREDGKVKKRWEYIGTSLATGRQVVTDEVMQDLSRVLLHRGISAKDIAAVAKRHGLRLPRSETKVVTLENDRPRRKLSARFQ